MGEALKSNNVLEELDVSSNRINTEGAVCLAKGKVLFIFSLRKLESKRGKSKRRKNEGKKRLKNKALRLVTSSDWNASAAPLYQKLNILSLSKLNKFEIAKFIFNYSSKCLPTTFDQYFILAITSHSQSTRYSASDHLRIPLYKTNRLQRFIKFVGPKI